MQNLLQGAVVQKFILRISKVRYSQRKRTVQESFPSCLVCASFSVYESLFGVANVLRLLVHETGVHALVLQIFFDARDVGAHRWFAVRAVFFCCSAADAMNTTIQASYHMIVVWWKSSARFIGATTHMVPLRACRGRFRFGL